MTEVAQSFSFPLTHQKLRILVRDDKPWFVLVDVCKALGLTNPSKTAQALDDDEKLTLTLNDGHSGQRGGAQSQVIINEPGFYHVVIRSNKPVAKKFQRWVMWEVLPTIRQTGSYTAQPQPTPSIQAEPLPCVWVSPEVIQLKAFAREHCVRTPGNATYASLIWRRYKQWCARNRCNPQPFWFFESMFIAWSCTKVIKDNRVAYVNVGLK